MRVCAARHVLTAAIAACALVPARAHAEVIDKCEMPWAIGSVLPALGVVVVCAALAWTRRRSARVLASLLAIGWAVGRIASDPLQDPVVGPALATELGAEGADEYRLAVSVLAVLPLVLVGVAALVPRRGSADALSRR
jgi:hypothetical protein